MKKTIVKLFLAAATMFAALMHQGCMKTDPAAEEESGERYPVSVSIPALESNSDSNTKVLTTEGEDAVKDLQVFVFRQNGVLDAYKRGSTTTLEMNCTVGTKNVVAVVNGPKLNCTSYSELAASISSLSDNAVSKFVMVGSDPDAEITAGSNTVKITVSRLVARVSIKKITNSLSLSAEQYANTPIKISKIYLVNVAGNCPYINTASPTTWWNKTSTSTDLPALLSSGTLNATVPANDSYEVVHYFYCYPNSTATDSNSSAWSPRYTRLVVQAEIGGKVYYYPVNIRGNSGIEANHKYEIEELTITRLGSESPDVPVSVGAVNVNITVAEWEVGTASTVTI